MTHPNPAEKYERVITYIDGFNLYYGLKEGGLNRFYWLDLRMLSLQLLRPQQKLVEVKYFTARVSDPADKRKRQSNYLEALQAHCGIQPFEGQFLAKPVECFGCHRVWPDHEEKMTDVNIATQLLMDAWKDRFDLAIIVSGDSDLVPPIASIKEEFPHKNVLVAFPPDRVSRQLQQTTASFHINEKAFRNCQLPDVVVKPDGTELHRPATWK